MVIGAGEDLISTLEVFLKEHGWGDFPVIAWKNGSSSKWLDLKEYP